MTKHNELLDVSYKLSQQHFENIFNVYEDEQYGYFYNLLKTVNFPDDLDPSTYDYYTVEANDQLPLISWKVYKTVFLWWVICAVNKIDNPIEPINSGTKLKILKPLVLRTVLNSIGG